MAASIETQRLISVSLGKIAQSRGQRGGINLHKNLLVATVLHKARTAYMMESYGYQQSLQRQKLQEQQQQVQSPVQTVISTPVSVADKAEEVCQVPHDSNLGQLAATPASSVESGSESSTVSAQEAVAPEPMTVHEVESEVAQDKENSPPVSADRFISLENVSTLNTKSSSDDHLIAATQLSQEAQSASTEFTSVKQQQNLTSAVPTCNNVLKRRRDNPTAGSHEIECPVSKKARVSLESSYTSFTDYSSDFADISSDESESDSESDSEIMQTSDSPQISNLVSIFNSGFSGLCAVSQQDSDLSSSDYQSDCDISNSSQLSSSLSKLRPESPSPAYSRKMSEPSLLCSSQVGRLESLPSAILLSA